MAERKPRRPRRLRKRGAEGVRRPRGNPHTEAKRAEELGPLTPVEPASRRVDGFPELGRDQVYAFRAGEVYHPIDCEIVRYAYDDDPTRVLVVPRDGVGRRRMCATCAETAV